MTRSGRRDTLKNETTDSVSIGCESLEERKMEECRLEISRPPATASVSREAERGMLRQQSCSQPYQEVGLRPYMLKLKRISGEKRGCRQTRKPECMAADQPGPTWEDLFGIFSNDGAL